MWGYIVDIQYRISEVFKKMNHEENGHIVKKKIAMDVQCRGELGHKYRIDLSIGPKGCPVCGEHEYDIRKEIYEGDEPGAVE